MARGMLEEEEIREGRMDGPGWLAGWWCWLQIRTPPRREGRWEMPRSEFAWQSGKEPPTERWSVAVSGRYSRTEIPATQPQ